MRGREPKQIMKLKVTITTDSDKATTAYQIMSLKKFIRARIKSIETILNVLHAAHSAVCGETMRRNIVVATPNISNGNDSYEFTTSTGKVVPCNGTPDLSGESWGVNLSWLTRFAEQVAAFDAEKEFEALARR